MPCMRTSLYVTALCCGASMWQVPRKRTALAAASNPVVKEQLTGACVALATVSTCPEAHHRSGSVWYRPVLKLSAHPPQTCAQATCC